MRTLLQALTRSGDDGAQLPPLFNIFSQAGILPRRSEITMIAGRPGSGKSLLALTMAIKLGLPTLFFSADSSATTVAIRAAAMALGRTTDEVEAMTTGSGVALVEDALAAIDHVHFCFDPSPTLDDLDLELRAFVEREGVPPSIIVADNLVNFVAEVEGEFYGQKELMSSFHTLARDTGAACLVLHHTTESAAEGRPYEPQGSRAVMGKINQLPAMILTVALNPLTDEYKVAAVKNRSGRAVADGSEPVTLFVDLPRMALYEDRQALATNRHRNDWV